MNIRFFITLLICLFSAAVGCQRGAGDPHEKKSTGEEEHELAATRDESEEHHHGERDEISDLDRPVEELFEADCEHSMKAYQCDECRYEVGVVRAPKSLFDGGLLSTEQAALRPISTELALTGEVQFDERRVAHVSTPVGGIVKQVHVVRGDSVKRGQSLVAIDSVAAGEARADYLEARGILALSEKNYQRLKALEREGIPSQKELLKGEQDLEAARIRADAARGKLARLGMAGGESKAGGRLALRSPIAGTVLEMHAVSGEVVGPEEPLLTVGDNGSLWVWADLYERDVGQVMAQQEKKPLEAVVTVKAFPGEEFHGMLDYLSPTMVRSSRTAKARIVVQNHGGRLLAGMFADVTLLMPTEKSVLSVPEGAVLADEGREFVFMHHKGSYYVRRPVVTEHRSHGWIEVESGLKEGDTVVTGGAFLLKSDVLRSKMGAGCAD